MDVRKLVTFVPVVVFACLAIVGPAAGEPGRSRPVSPQVPIATPSPVPFELALDEVELHWAKMPAGRRSPLVSTAGVLGASVRSQRRGQAIMTMAKVADAAELRDVAAILQRANPGSVAGPVFYEVGAEHSGATRRIGTSNVRIVTSGAAPESLIDTKAWRIRRGTEAADAYVLEAEDPMAALRLTTALHGRAGVTSISLAAIPERVMRKREGLVGAIPKPFDQPEQAQDFFAFKRRPAGDTGVPVERYQTALEHMRRMPRRSTRDGVTVPAPPEGVQAPSTAILSSWTPLGPANIGGRTRALVIAPDGRTFYAGGVAGGVWKSTDAGGSWAPTSDLIANIAVGSLAMDPASPSILYAGTGEGYFNIDSVRGNGIFKTSNGGATWTQLASTTTIDFRFVNKIVISPNRSSRLYAATRTGVFRSLDAGATWTQVVFPTITTGCTDLAIRTDWPTDWLLASCGAGAIIQGTIYLNRDAGGSGGWAPVLGPAQGGEGAMARTSLAISPSSQNIVYAVAASNLTFGNFAFGGLHAVFRSTDGGATWSARVRNTSSTKLNTLLLTNPIIASGLECGSPPSAYFNQGWYDNVIAVDPVDFNRVWVGGIDLFRSDDGGTSWGLASYWWVSPSSNRYVHADQHAIVFHPGYNGGTNTIMFVGNDGGLFVTADARAATAKGLSAACQPAFASMTWSNMNNGYAVTQFYHGLPYPGGTAYFGGTQDNGTLRGGDPAGFNWSRLLGGDGGFVAIDPTNTNVLYAENFNLSIQKSTDGGSSFVDATNGITEDFGNFLFINPFVMDPSFSPRLWTGGFYAWRTHNGAANWAQASAALCGGGSVSAIAVAPTNSNRVAMGMSDGCINLTTVGVSANNSTVWAVTQPPGTDTAYNSSLTYDPRDENILYATYSTFGVPHVWRSTNGGATWTNIDGSGVARIPDVPVHSLVVDPGNTARLFVGTDVGVFSSDDRGATWAVENTGFANVITEALAVENVGATSHVFAFTHGRGVWRVPTAAPPAQLVLAAITNRTTVTTGQTLTIAVSADNPGLPFAVDFYLGLLLPDGDTIAFLTQGGAAVAFGTFSNLASYQPGATGISLATPFNRTTPPIVSYTLSGTEPVGTWTVFFSAFRAGTTELVARGQTFVTVTR